MTSRVSAISLSIFIAAIQAACNDGDKPLPPHTGADTGTPGPEYPFGTPYCGGYCEVYLVLDSSELEACYGYDEDGWGGVGPAVPQEILDYCLSPAVTDTCLVPGVQIEPCENTCGECLPLVYDESGNAVPPEDGCCQCYPVGNRPELMYELEVDCGIDGAPLEVLCPEPSWYIHTEEECDDGDSFAKAPGADVILHVDPLESYVYLSTPLDTETFAVAGGGTARTAVDRFMTATVWPADGSFMSYTLADWVFWSSAPIDYDPVSGNFTVQNEGAPAFLGRGVIDGVYHSGSVQMANDATGNLNASTHTWQADYTESHLGNSVHVHLEGTWENL